MSRQSAEPDALDARGLTMLVHGYLEASASRSPRRPVLIEPSGETSYGELDARANRFANLLATHRIAPGDRVVMALANGRDLATAYLGALKAGAVAVPLPAGPRSDRFATAIAECTPRAAVIGTVSDVSPSWQRTLASVPAVFVWERETNRAPAPWIHLEPALQRCSPDPCGQSIDDTHLAAIIYTSGSTGKPRGVMLSHRNFVANAASIVHYLRLTVADRVMCVLPFYYVYGLSLLHTHLAVGGALVIENRAAFSNVILDSMRQHQVTGLAGVPSTFALMLHRSNLSAIELPSLRYVTQAGGAMPPALIAEWLECGPVADFYVMYGATEAAARLTYLPPADLRRKLGSIGRAIPGVEIRVITQQGDIAAAGEIGELVATGDNIACGYWNDPEETARRFTPAGFRTGDLGYADEAGYLYLVGRRQDMIKVGAHRVGAIEIENVLHGHPAVADAAVMPMAHPLLGEAPVACVVLRQPLADAERTLRAFCAERLATYKVPIRIVELTELPQLPGTGKRHRAVLIERLQSLASGFAPTVPDGASQGVRPDGASQGVRSWHPGPRASGRRTGSRSSANPGSRGSTPGPPR